MVASLANPKKVLIQPLNFSDKLLHALSYTVLMLSWMMVLKSSKKLKYQFYLWLVLLLFGIIIELLQGTLTHYRTADFKDVLANLVGLTLGWMIFKLLKIN